MVVWGGPGGPPRGGWLGYTIFRVALFLSASSACAGEPIRGVSVSGCSMFTDLVKTRSARTRGAGCAKGRCTLLPHWWRSYYASRAGAAAAPAARVLLLRQPRGCCCRPIAPLNRLHALVPPRTAKELPASMQSAQEPVPLPIMHLAPALDEHPPLLLPWLAADGWRDGSAAAGNDGRPAAARHGHVPAAARCAASLKRINKEYEVM